MKFRVERDQLADGVSWAARALPTRPPIPTLAGLRLESAGDDLVISGFDMESSSSAGIAADVEEPGVMLVSGRLLADISRSLPNHPVTVCTDGQRAELRCGRSTFLLPLLPVEDYPTLPTMPDPIGTVAGSVFAAAVSSVAVAAGRDDTLPMLQGIRLEFEGDRLAMAATDRYRLAVRELRWDPTSTSHSGAALVPARVLADTAKQLSGAGEVAIAQATGAGDGLIGFEGDGRRTTTRLLDGEFPKYRQLFPDSSVASARVDAAALSDAVKRVSLVAERNSSVRLHFRADQVDLHAGSGDDANADETVESTLTGDDIEISFNPQYLLDGIGAVGSTVVEFSFTGSTKPAVLSPPTKPGPVDYRYLLMPVRI
ncbi:MAG: DNA polymerase III subunit beta [Candidatus Nanopelagicales bacterium]|nr:DNA polymerase III subunit beta [Candidatus Nanopelagicales bacterium]